VEGGTIWLRTSLLAQERLLIVVEDDGEGIPEERLEDLFQATGDSGIGVNNVRERLEVLYDADFRMTVESRLGQGTRTEIEIPVRRNVTAGLHYLKP
jgi:sensor histidine kinase YesM